MHRTVMLLAILVGGIPQPTLSEEYQNAQAEIECTAAAPEPILLPNSYGGQKFTRGKYNQAMESALIDSETKLKISHSGCFDGIQQKFTFVVKSHPNKDSDIVHWAAFAKKKIAILKIDQTKEWMVNSLAGFLGRVPKYEAENNKVSVCKDDSMPDIDGCAFETGGEYFFELKREGDALHVIAGQYYAL